MQETVTIPVNRRVMAGDIIGLQNLKDCELNICFQPAIQSNNAYDTVLYSSTGGFSDLVPQSGVFLNIQASIIIILSCGVTTATLDGRIVAAIVSSLLFVFVELFLSAQ